MSHIHLQKRRGFLKAAGCLVGSGAASTLVPQFSMLGTALAGTITTGYKALVCIYFDGGGDSWNMLIPATQDRHTEYVAARGGLYQGNATALGIPITGGGGTFLPNALPLLGTVGGNSYALNPFCQDLANLGTPGTGAGGIGLQTLYNERKLAFIANIGPLVDPYRKTGNPAGTRRPPQLYSHNDQTNLWQLGGGTTSTNPNGWGGRLAGNLIAGTPASGLSPCISIAGQSRFLSGNFESSGNPLNPYRLSDSTTSPATALANYATTGDTANQGPARRAALTSLLNATYPQLFTTEYKDIVTRSMALADTINAQITTNIPATFQTALNLMPNTSLGRQLRQVAQMIRISRAGQGTIQANRQIFFVRIGGFDTHDGQITSLTAAQGHHGLLQQIGIAMHRFQNCIEALNALPTHTGVLNEVLTFTASDFARTLNSNGNGTDHAWGGVQMVMGNPNNLGGPLLGQNIYGPYPRQTLNLTQNDASPLPVQERGESYNRGEFIPRVAVDQMAATLARWMGASDSEIPLLFPNLDTMLAHSQASLLGFQSRTVPFLV